MKNKLNDTALIIIGSICIEDNIPFSTTITDTLERKNQYCESIEYAIKNYDIIEKIIFCENTNYNHDYSSFYTLAASYNKQFEILSFLGNKQKIKQLGKGFGEGEAINYCLENSTLLKNCVSFIKLTGRLKISNFNSLFNNTNGNIFMLSEIVAKLPNSDIRTLTVIYKTQINYYKQYLRNVHETIRDSEGYYLEHAVFHKNRKNKISAFLQFPIIIGISGSTGSPYTLNQIELLLSKFRFKLGFYNYEKSKTTSLCISAYAYIYKLYSLIIKIKHR